MIKKKKKKSVNLWMVLCTWACGTQIVNSTTDYPINTRKYYTRTQTPNLLCSALDCVLCVSCVMQLYSWDRSSSLPFYWAMRNSFPFRLKHTYCSILLAQVQKPVSSNQSWVNGLPLTLIHIGAAAQSAKEMWCEEVWWWINTL